MPPALVKTLSDRTNWGRGFECFVAIADISNSDTIVDISKSCGVGILSALNFIFWRGLVVGA